MKPKSIIFIILCVIAPVFTASAAASKCSKANLARCMDSACAINIGVNPSARCQYCGTSSAGTPPKMKNVTAGQSTKYAIAARDLANAPSDPEKRYIWATNECIKKLTDCTQDDVAVAYDTLIEQSCRAAGVTIQVAKTSASMGEKPTQKKCETNIKTCITKKCGASYESCGTDADIDRSVSECAIDAKGCEEYISGIRDTAKSELNSLIEHNEAALRAVAQKKQQERDTNVNTAFINCENNIGITSCETEICKKLEGKCTDEYAETEKAMAKELCKYHKTACTMLK